MAAGVVRPLVRPPRAPPRTGPTSAPRPMSAPTRRAHLARLAALADANAAELARLVDGLDATRLLWRPSPERWGIADCCEHLIATGTAYHPRIRAALAQAPRDAAGDDRRWTPTWFGRLFVHLAGPRGRAIRARGPFVPPQARPGAPRRLLAQQDELRALIADAHGVDLRAVRIPSPLGGWLTLRLGEALEMLLEHQRRHLAQAWRVREAASFPGVRAGGVATDELPVVRETGELPAVPTGAVGTGRPGAPAPRGAAHGTAPRGTPGGG